MSNRTRPLWGLDTVFARALAVAVLLHLPLVPVRYLDWVRIFLSSGGDYDDRDAQAIVPIDLDIQDRDLVAEPPAPPPPAPTAPPTPEPVAAAPVPKPKPKPPPAPASTGTADAGAPSTLKDPLSAAGPAGRISAKDPNVQLLISGRVLRKHPLGAWAGSMLVTIPDWRSFFEGSFIDPIRDLDHILITSPRLKGDNSKMVAVLDMNVGADRMREAVDRMLHKSDGVWLEDAPVDTARARVLGAPRLFAVLPDRHLLVLLPADAKDQLPRLKHAKGFRNSAEGVVVSLLTPWRPFKEFFPLPESLKWIRFALTPTGDGGVDLTIDAGDGGAEDATRHAADLTREIEARRKVSVLGLTSIEIVDPVSFTAKGDLIQARTHVPPQKLRLIMDWIETKARERYGLPVKAP